MSFYVTGPIADVYAEELSEKKAGNCRWSFTESYSASCEWCQG